MPKKPETKKHAQKKLRVCSKEEVQTFIQGYAKSGDPFYVADVSDRMGVDYGCAERAIKSLVEDGVLKDSHGLYWDQKAADRAAEEELKHAHVGGPRKERASKVDREQVMADIKKMSIKQVMDKYKVSYSYVWVLKNNYKPKW